MASNVSGAAIDEFTIDDIAKFDLPDLARIHDEIRDAAKTWRDRQTKIVDALELRFAARAVAMLTTDKKDAGTIHFPEAGFDIERKTSKSVAYDQEIMLAIYRRIIEAKENPLVYMKLELSINESAYKDWPANVKSEFDKARAVKASRASYAFKKVG